MKKIFVSIAVAVLAAASVSAQSLSVGAGYESYKFSSKIGDNDPSTGEPLAGFYAGASATVAKLGPIAVTPGIYFEYASQTASASIGTLASGSVTNKEMYLDVPVNFSYGIDLGPACVSIYAGPTFSLGASSSSQAEGSVLGVGGSTDPTDNYADGSNYGRFDILVGGGLAIDIACIRVSAGYNFGLLDRNTTDNVKYTRSGLHAGIAYLF